MPLRRAALVCLLFGALSVADPASAAEILLDQPVRVGDVILYPSRSDPDKYYYVPTRVRLARENGLPKFSFLRWVDNVRGEDAADAREGIGGGIVHATVQLGLTEEELEQLRDEFRSVRARGRVEGPIIPNGGEFALISSFAEPDGQLTRSLVGVGPAPILEGSRASISLQVTKLGAKILWESFHSATPDVSFLMNLEIEGYRSPKEATLEADFDRIYEHENFNADLKAQADAKVAASVPVDKIAAALGASIPIPIDVGVAASVGGYFHGQIDETFEELRESGAIRIESTAADAEMMEIIQQAYSDLREMMFQPASSQPSSGGAAMASRAVSTREGGAGSAKPVAKPNKGDGKKPNGKASAVGNPQSTDSQSGADPLAMKKGPPEGVEPPIAKPDPKKQAGKPVEGGGDAEARKRAEAERLRKEAEKKKILDRPTAAAPTTGPSVPGAPCSGVAGAGGGGGSGVSIQASVALEVCLTMKYEFKEKKHSGKYRIDLRKYTASTLRVPFSENIGDLRRHLDNDAMFRSVNLADPLFRQRTVVARLNEITDESFDGYLNSVSVQLRKVYEDGEDQFDEATIDRSRFNDKENEFRLVYGWGGDAPDAAWEDYEWRALWSFAGGVEREMPWTPGSFSLINLDPPFEIFPIRLEGSADYLSEAPVRSITVRLFQDVNGEERVVQETLRADRGDLSRHMRLTVPRGQYDYDYEISWRLRGNQTRSTGRQRGNEGILYVDEIPE